MEGHAEPAVPGMARRGMAEAEDPLRWNTLANCRPSCRAPAFSRRSNRRLCSLGRNLVGPADGGMSV